MNKLVKIFIPIALIVLVFNSCKKKQIDNETQSITDHILCEQEFMRILPTINGKAINNQGVKRLNSNYTITSVACPKDSTIGDTTWGSPSNLPGILLDYGTGCADERDGKVRSGKVEARFSKSYDSTGCVVTISLINYVSAGLTYSGTVRYTRNSPYSFTMEVINGLCSKSNVSIKWNSTRTVTWKSGFSTPSIESDDIMEISGSASGTNREGLNFSTEIKSPLLKNADCKWLQSGIETITPEGLKPRSVDFGSNSCDNEGTYSIEGKTIRFVMQ